MKSAALIPEICISDFNKSLDFYTKILGFLIEYKREDEGFAFLSREGAQIMIDQIDKGRTWKTGKLVSPLGRGINFSIRVRNINILLETLKKNNIPLFMELEEKWYKKINKEVGNKQFLVQDPDGYLLRFHEDLGTRSILI